jgi:hypothetical protein
MKLLAAVLLQKSGSRGDQVSFDELEVGLEPLL